MSTQRKPDFAGWATRNDLRCSDGRTIRKDAFAHNDGMWVPLLWNHQHNDPNNVIGKAYLRNRPKGVRAEGYFNDTEKGQNSKLAVMHGDVVALSIFANKLQQNGGDVLHGDIKEVSLVLAGANPGAFIDEIIEHGDSSNEGAIIYTGESLDLNNFDDQISHAEESADDEETVADVFNTLTDKQKTVVYAIIGQALEDKGENSEAAHSEMFHAEEASDGEETVADVFNTLTDKQKTVVYAIIGQALENKNSEGEDKMKHNAFESADFVDDDMEVISHSEMMDVINDSKRFGSMRESALQHGITNIEYLFPEARNFTNTPIFDQRDQAWVSKVMNGVHHTPFSRIKSLVADITGDDARALGYVKGNLKKEEVFSLLKRTTDAQTIYKKQKLHRDDVIDITDFDVVAWLKSEMRMMLDEEIARAILIGDGRLAGTDDKIDPTHIRPIASDADLYTVKVTVNAAANATSDDKAKAAIRAIIKARKDYKGSGSPTMFTTEDFLTDMLLLEDANGKELYTDEAQLAKKLRVKEIVTVPVMENQAGPNGGDMVAVIVNLNDYNVGADKGGAVNMFDDFDIDYNAQKYLIETRISGALVKPYSAMAVEIVTADDND